MRRMSVLIAGFLTVIVPINSQYTVTIYPQILSQNGRTRFEPDRWNSHNGLDGQSFIPKMKDMGTRTGRWLNPDLGIFPNATEDPNRRGFPDPRYFNNQSVQQKLCSTYLDDLTGYGQSHDVVIEITGQFWPQWMNTSLHGGVFPNDIDAAAEMIALLVDAVYSCANGSIPTYWEVINEPDALWQHLTWDTVIQFHKLVAYKLHAKYPALKVGGPTKDGSISGLDQQNFSSWHPVRDFMNMSLYHMDFFSFHPYNSFTSKGNAHHFNGINEARLVAVIDLLQSYAQLFKGNPVPLVLSEFGQGRRFLDPQTPDSLVQWAYIFQHNAHMFTYLNHRGVIDQAVAFLVNLATDQFADASLFYPNGSATNDAMAFRFWKKFSYTDQFLRVDSQCNGKERMVSPLAVVDLGSGEVTVLLTNYAQTSEMVYLNFSNNWLLPSTAQATCLYLSENKAPVLSLNKTTNMTGNGVSLPPESSCYISMAGINLPGSTPVVNEITAYSRDIVMPISDNVILTEITLPNIANVAYAQLRFGVSNSNMTALTQPTTLTVNGYLTYSSYSLHDPDRNTGVTKWEVYNYRVDTAIVFPGENIIKLEFAQNAGFVSTVAMLVGTFDTQ